MPRILNAKQTAAMGTRMRPGLPEPGQEFVLLTRSGGMEPIIAELRRDGVLSTPFGPGRIDRWTLVPAVEGGTFYIKNVDSGLFVVDGYGPNPVRVGPHSETPAAVRISEDDDFNFTIKAPNADLVWTYIPLRPFDQIQYIEADGSVAQQWVIHIIS